jgi:hypothetical protein
MTKQLDLFEENKNDILEELLKVKESLDNLISKISIKEDKNKKKLSDFEAFQIITDLIKKHRPEKLYFKDVTKLLDEKFKASGYDLSTSGINQHILNYEHSRSYKFLRVVKKSTTNWQLVEDNLFNIAKEVVLEHFQDFDESYIMPLEDAIRLANAKFSEKFLTKMSDATFTNYWKRIVFSEKFQRKLFIELTKDALANPENLITFKRLTSVFRRNHSKIFELFFRLYSNLYLQLSEPTLLNNEALIREKETIWQLLIATINQSKNLSEGKKDNFLSELWRINRFLKTIIAISK